MRGPAPEWTIRKQTVRTHLCPPFLGASSAACFGWISGFGLCSQSTHLPCSSTALDKRFERNINASLITVLLENKLVQLRNGIKNWLKDALFPISLAICCVCYISALLHMLYWNFSVFFYNHSWSKGQANLTMLISFSRLQSCITTPSLFSTHCPWHCSLYFKYLLLLIYAF